MEIKNIKCDEHGHLVDFKKWDKSIGQHLAEMDGCELTPSHWHIINLVREIYLQTETSPPMRLLIKVIKNSNDNHLASSRTLYRLFPDGPVRLACKYAGLPKPKHCL